MLFECHSLNSFDKMSLRVVAELGPAVKKYGKM